MNVKEPNLVAGEDVRQEETTSCPTPGQAPRQAGAIDPFDPESFKPAIITGNEESAAKAPSPAAISETPVKLLVFDMGHVFIDFDWNEVCQGFCNKATVDRDAFRKVLAHLGSLGYEVGKVDTAEFLAELNDQLQCHISLEEFSALWNATFAENAEMAVLLPALGKKYPLYLLSNTNENHYDFLQSRFNVARHFKELILSYQVGFSKPDARIYQEVLKRSGLKAEECLFVDDLEPNIKAAQALGLHTIRFVGVADLKQRLNELGITF